MLKKLRVAWKRLAHRRRTQKAKHRKTGERGHARLAARIGRRMRKVRGRINRIAKDPRRKAVRWASRWPGMTEDPPGSNRGRKISQWQLDFGSWLVGKPWCGVFLGQALKVAGVAITSRVASVALIEEDAKAGKNGFKSWHGPYDGCKGDALVIGGHGVHTELARFRVPGVGYATYGGNTSSGRSGSQDNGGGVWPRVRRYSEVHGCARPAYPKV